MARITSIDVLQFDTVSVSARGLVLVFGLLLIADDTGDVVDVNPYDVVN